MDTIIVVIKVSVIAHTAVKCKKTSHKFYSTVVVYYYNELISRLIWHCFFC